MFVSGPVDGYQLAPKWTDLRIANAALLIFLTRANPEAHQLYLKGLFYWNKRTPEALKTSIDYSNQAIEKDPSYALAYAGMAEAYVLLPDYYAGTPQDSYPKAKVIRTKPSSNLNVAIKIALRISRTLKLTHSSTAFTLTRASRASLSALG